MKLPGQRNPRRSARLSGRLRSLPPASPLTTARIATGTNGLGSWAHGLMGNEMKKGNCVWRAVALFILLAQEPKSPRAQEPNTLSNRGRVSRLTQNLLAIIHDLRRLAE